MNSIEKELEGIRAELARLRENIAKPLPQTLTQKHAAKELSISQTKLKGMVRSGLVLTVTVGKAKMVPISEIRRLATPVTSTRKGRSLASKVVKHLATTVDSQTVRDALKRRR